MLRTERKTEQKVIELQKALKQADTILIGAGAGLSASAGFAYGGEQFHRYFADFEEKYGFHDMYSGGFYPFPTLEEHWAYWSRFVFLNRYCDPPKPVYQNLLELVKDKDYFVYKAAKKGKVTIQVSLPDSGYWNVCVYNQKKKLVKQEDYAQTGQKFTVKAAKGQKLYVMVKARTKSAVGKTYRVTVKQK